MPAVDRHGTPIKVGQKVARAAKLFQMDGLYVELVEVTTVMDDKVWLAGSTRPIKFNDRVIVFN